ncbi:MAG TPA: GAF domain-containing protein, partial [Mycobacteriales bacterium]|nr:GAF domain-containing protein [Mycobacteriales bacterium]
MTELDRAKRLGLRVYLRLTERRDRAVGLSALVDAARELAGECEPGVLLDVVTRRARLLLGVDMAYVGLMDEADGSMQIRAADGHTSALTVGLQLPGGAGLGRLALEDLAPVWTRDYLVDEHIPHSEVIDEVVQAEGLHAILAVPLRSGARRFGVLYVADRAVREFTADERSLVSSLADLAGMAIEKARRLEQADDAVAELAGHLRAARRLVDVQDRLIELLRAGSDLNVFVKEASDLLDAAVQIWASDGVLLASSGEAHT